MKKTVSILTLVLSSMLVGVVLFYIVKNLRKPKPQKSPVLVAADSARYYKQKADSISLSLDSATAKYIEYETARIFANYRLFNNQRNRSDSAIIEAVRQSVYGSIYKDFGRQPDPTGIHPSGLPAIADSNIPAGGKKRPPPQAN